MLFVNDIIKIALKQIQSRINTLYSLDYQTFWPDCI